MWASNQLPLRRGSCVGSLRLTARVEVLPPQIRPLWHTRLQKQLSQSFAWSTYKQRESHQFEAQRVPTDSNTTSRSFSIAFTRVLTLPMAIPRETCFTESEGGEPNREVRNTECEAMRSTKTGPFKFSRCFAYFEVFFPAETTAWS